MIYQEIFQNLLLLPIFILFVFIFFYLPGRLALRQLKVKLIDIDELGLSFVLGMMAFTIGTVVFGLIHLRFLNPLVFLLLGAYSFKKHGFPKLPTNRNLNILIILGILLLGFINFPSGLRFDNGMNFWSSQGHDGLWHVSLMEEIRQNFPPTIPLYAGHALMNYHYWVDVLLGEFYRVLPFLGSLNLYFRFFPILFAVLIGTSIFSLASRLWNKSVALWAVFFAYFAGSFGYIYSLIKGYFPLSGETTFWASQGNTILGNPPHAVGIIFLTYGFFLLLSWLETGRKAFLWLIFAVTFCLATIKVSSGLIFVASLLVAGIHFYLKNKKASLLLFSLIVAGSNYLFLKLISPTAQSFLVFNPLWFPRTMMVTRLDWMDWELRRQHYIYVNTLKSRLHQIWLEIQAVLLFVVGNSGMRVLGMIELLRRFRNKFDTMDYALLTAIFAPVVVVLLFVQNGVTYNLIQFAQIYLHVFGLFAGASVYFLLQKLKKQRLFQYLLAIVIIAFTIPTSIGNLFDFYGPGKKPLAYVSNLELEALNWVKTNTSTDSVLMTKPFDKNAHYGYKDQPLPISAWYSTSYINALTGRSTLLTGQEQLQITGYQIEPDLEKINSFFSSEKNSQRVEVLRHFHPDYIYLRKAELDQVPSLDLPSLNKVFENKEVVIYRYYEVK